ncbi:MAG: histidine--tRNA ligase [Mucispirillum sp.]|nr:histidine--tRNA ligase [Mucispirillum sp.]
MLKKVKGFRDIFGEDLTYWHYAEEKAQKLFKSYGFHEFRLPVLEKTAVFKRGIGETTDIVEKEMFSFIDGDENVSLRPEGTAALMRAYTENNLHNPPGVKKYYYLGNMFRRERPQKGRFRQFTQIGAEVLECESPLLDAEVISLLYNMAVTLHIEEFVSMEINSIGCSECRPQYKKALVDYFTSYEQDLCCDCKRRLHSNPMRILDCKSDGCKSLGLNAPVISDYLCGACSEHFGNVKKYLDIMEVPYKINARMVRGLDYYVRTAFELVTDKLGAASAVGAGGRYDGLVKSLGGKDVSGIGFAAGLDRIVELLKELHPIERSGTDVFVQFFDENGFNIAKKLINDLRKNGFVAEYDYDLASIKSQMKKADKANAKFAVIYGSNEIACGNASIKNLISGEQVTVTSDSVFSYLSEALKKGNVS